MCLAKVYVGPGGPESGTSLLLENVTRVDIKGDDIRVVSLLGEAKELRARVSSIDFSEGRLELQTLDASAA